METTWGEFLEKVKRNAQQVKDWEFTTLQSAIKKHGFEDDPIQKGDIESMWKQLQGTSLD
jgi:hypothetical protein